MKELLKRVARDLELPILAFPITVTLVVALGFMLKCSCSIAEWWLSFALTLVMVWFCAKDRVIAIATTVALSIMLVLLWLGANLFTTSGCEDTLAYHQPAIRMLASGWNPIYQGTPEGILDATGLTSDMICVWHVIAMPKGVWYFSAVAYLFTNAHFNLLFPLMPILYCSLFYAVYNAFCGYGKRFAMCAYLGILFFIHAHYEMLVDGVVALSAIGLLVTMWDSLRTGKWSWLRLIGFSFWMVVAKQPSQLHCACFWLLFLVFSMVKNRKLYFKRFLLSGMVLLAAFCIVNVAPYGSSYVNYGSPFYPRYSGDEEKHPTRNITGDFFDRNEDAAAMGHLGAYVNAFVSTSAAKTYYALKTGKKDFCPDSSVWAQQCPGRSIGSPTTFLFRFMYCASLIVLCLLGGLCGRFMASCLIVGCIAMPTEMIGFTRYVPFALAGCPLGVLAVVSAVRHAQARRWLLGAVSVLFTAVVAARFAMFCAITTDRGHAIRQSLKSAPPSAMVSSFHKRYEKNMSGNLTLLQKCVPELSAATLIVEPQSSIGQLEKWHPYFDYSFKVPPEYPICKFSALRQIINLPQRKQRFMAYPKFIVRTIFITLSKSIWEVIYE